MPALPPTICACGRRKAYGAVCDCQRHRKAEREKARPGARQRGYGAAWEKASRAFLALPENRYCACGCGRRADMVDHRLAHKGDPGLFWDRTNWQPMSRRCNSRKAAQREGGFGNPIARRETRIPSAAMPPDGQ